MKNTFAKKFTVCTLAGVLGAAFIGCGDDDSSSPKGTGLPAEVADMEELETYGCGMDVIGEKVYVTELEENYECDGEKWFKSYDQTRPSSTSTKSSSSKKSDGSSDSKAADKDGSSSSDATTSSSSAKSSSSRPTEILEPEITVNETCTEVGACDAMVKTDISTWHFVRKDDFGDDAEYTYTVDGKDLIVTIKSADGSTDSKTYSMYNMESEAGVEMAFNAAKSTCKNGGGNDNKVKSCVKDTVKALPECNASREGFIGKKDSSYVICRSGSWIKASVLEYDTYGLECFDDGRVVTGNVVDSNIYVCEKGAFRVASEKEVEFYNDTYGLTCVDGRIVTGAVNPTNKYMCESGRFRTATEWEKDTEGLDCIEGEIAKGEKETYVCESGKFRIANSMEKHLNKACSAKNEGMAVIDSNPAGYYSQITYYTHFCNEGTWRCIMFWEWDVPKEVRFNKEIDYGVMTDNRDNKVYKTVKIGSQVWMAENLNYYDSATMPLDEMSSCFNDKDENCDVGGRLYNWNAAVDSVTLAKNIDFRECETSAILCKLPSKIQGACPNGWHLPDTLEWVTLFNAVGGISTAGKVLKSLTGWGDKTANGYSGLNGTDVYGFSVLPTGYVERWGGSKGLYWKYEYESTQVLFWSTTQYGNGVTAFTVGFHRNSDAVLIDNHVKTLTRLPVRCIKDSE